MTIVAVDNFWNDDRVADLKRLWVDENLSGTQIAAALGLKDRNAVMGKIHRLGLTRKNAAASGEAAPNPVSVKSDAVAAVAAHEPQAAPCEPPPPIQEAPPSPPPTPEPAVEPDALAGHPVMQLKERSCRWPIGDPQKPDFRFCCAERLGSFPYCAEHAEISYMAPDRQSRRAPARDKAA